MDAVVACGGACWVCGVGGDVFSVEVEAPFCDVAMHVVGAKSAGSFEGDFVKGALCPGDVVDAWVGSGGELLAVIPVRALIEAGGGAVGGAFVTGGHFPLGLGGKVEEEACFGTQFAKEARAVDAVIGFGGPGGAVGGAAKVFVADLVFGVGVGGGYAIGKDPVVLAAG